MKKSSNPAFPGRKGRRDLAKRGLQNRSGLAIGCEYRDIVSRIFDAILREESSHMERAARLLARVVRSGRLIHVAGPGGHAVLPALEVFYRVGGLAPVNAIFPPGMNIMDAAPTMGRIAGTGRFILNFHRLRRGDVLVLYSAFGLTISAVDLALEAKRRGVRLVTVNSHAFARRVPKSYRWRHPEKHNINDLADVALDIHAPYPDAVIRRPGVSQPILPTSTLAGCFALWVLMGRTIELLAESGARPEIWMSNNVPGGTERNARYVEKYRARIHHLYPVS